jgi:uncharacterized protein YndB with AHSA1/START domain
MPDIYHTFPINAPADKVFRGISTSEGIDRWWTKASLGAPQLNAVYKLSFGPGYDWSAKVSKFKENNVFELTMTESDKDWNGTKVGFILNQKTKSTEVQFYHTGWPQANEHYKISSYCWAMYLRILKRYLEFGEQVPFEKRLDQ